MQSDHSIRYMDGLAVGWLNEPHRRLRVQRGPFFSRVISQQDIPYGVPHTVSFCARATRLQARDHTSVTSVISGSSRRANSAKARRSTGRGAVILRQRSVKASITSADFASP